MIQGEQQQHYCRQEQEQRHASQHRILLVHEGGGAGGGPPFVMMDAYDPCSPRHDAANIAWKNSLTPNIIICTNEQSTRCQSTATDSSSCSSSDLDQPGEEGEQQHRKGGRRSRNKNKLFRRSKSGKNQAMSTTQGEDGPAHPNATALKGGTLRRLSQRSKLRKVKCMGSKAGVL